MKILILNGPNLHRLGRREPSIYGSTTLEQLNAELIALARDLGAELDCRQSNHEGDLVTWIGDAKDQGFAGVVMNPGAYTHTSYALYDAIKGADVPVVEVHISNPDAREEFRRHSTVAPAVIGRVAGFGIDSYRLGLMGLLSRLASG